MTEIEIKENAIMHLLSVNEYDYLARDKDGTLFAYHFAPSKGFSHMNYWMKKSHDRESVLLIDSTLFPNIKWENDNPTKVSELVIHG